MLHQEGLREVRALVGSLLPPAPGEGATGAAGGRGLLPSSGVPLEPSHPIVSESRTTVSQDVQTRFPVQLAFAKFLSRI